MRGLGRGSGSRFSCARRRCRRGSGLHGRLDWRRGHSGLSLDGGRRRAATALPTAPLRLLFGRSRGFDFSNGCLGDLRSGRRVLDHLGGNLGNLARRRWLVDDADRKQFGRRPFESAAPAAAGASRTHAEPGRLRT